ncbi:MAG: RagB/SusD family nutrient uptake outer membrane protein, partial [Prevotella sp.]|nr:RagB/SusD family nutrient uptake outer membrane protein [Prevotella sp.]
MKKILYSTLCAAGVLALTTSCSDYLETDSPSKTDAAFVFSTSETARAALEGAYADWINAAQNKVFGDGLFYAADVAGSDIERHPEGFTAQPGRHYPECFYQNGKYAGEYALLSYQKED